MFPSCLPENCQDSCRMIRQIRYPFPLQGLPTYFAPPRPRISRASLSKKNRKIPYSVPLPKAFASFMLCRQWIIRIHSTATPEFIIGVQNRNKAVPGGLPGLTEQKPPRKNHKDSPEGPAGYGNRLLVHEWFLFSIHGMTNHTTRFFRKQAKPCEADICFTLSFSCSADILNLLPWRANQKEPETKRGNGI